MASLATLATASVDSEGMIGDKQMEELLSEKLLEGYTLLDTACPRCVTPLVMKKAPIPSLSPKRSQSCTSPHMSVSFVNVQLQPSGSTMAASSSSFDQPIAPVPDVPYCVSCTAHVVTKESDITALEKSTGMKNRGSIIVAIDEDEREEGFVQRTFFPEPTERDSPEDEEEDFSDKENVDEDEESPQESMEEKAVFEPEETPVDEETPVYEEFPVEEEEERTLAEEEEEEEVTAEEEDDSSIVVENIKERETFVAQADTILARQASPSMASFLCASTASYQQYVVPSPVGSPKTGSFVEEEGIERELDEHSRFTEQVGSEAANSVLLPPKPIVSDLLQDGENEELDHVREVMSPHREVPAKKHALGVEEKDSTEEVMQEYSVR